MKSDIASDNALYLLTNWKCFVRMLRKSHWILARHVGSTLRGRTKGTRRIRGRGRTRKTGRIIRTRRMTTGTVMLRGRRAEQSKHNIFLLFCSKSLNILVRTYTAERSLRFEIY